MDRIGSDLRGAGFEFTTHTFRDKTVHSAFLRFPGLLYEAGLSPHEKEKLSVKLESDTDPPGGAETDTTVLNRNFLLSLWHYDLPSLLAGKIHALLERNYTKDRDIYDLLWDRSRSEPVEPNMKMLNNALEQADWSGPTIADDNWQSVVEKKLETLNWKEIREDVETFLENPEGR